MSSVLFGVKRTGARESAAETSAGFPRSGEVQKTVTVEPDTLLSPDSRLSLRGCACAPREDYRLGARQLSKNSSARGTVLALNQQGALVVEKMEESNRHSEEPVPAGVTALAKEIDDRLSNLVNGAATAELREVRREFTHRLKDAAPHVVIELASLLLDVPQSAYRFIAYELIHQHLRLGCGGLLRRFSRRSCLARSPRPE
jgi:hypothetical protein